MSQEKEHSSTYYLTQSYCLLAMAGEHPSLREPLDYWRGWCVDHQELLDHLSQGQFGHWWQSNRAGSEAISTQFNQLVEVFLLAQKAGCLPHLLNETERRVYLSERARLGTMGERRLVFPSLQIQATLQNLGGQTYKSLLEASDFGVSSAELSCRCQEVRQVLVAIAQERIFIPFLKAKQDLEKGKREKIWKRWFDQSGEVLLERVVDLDPVEEGEKDEKRQVLAFLKVFNPTECSWPIFWANLELKLLNEERPTDLPYPFLMIEIFLRNLTGESQEELSREYQVAGPLINQCSSLLTRMILSFTPEEIRALGSAQISREVFPQGSKEGRRWPDQRIQIFIDGERPRADLFLSGGGGEEVKVAEIPLRNPGALSVFQALCEHGELEPDARQIRGVALVNAALRSAGIRDLISFWTDHLGLASTRRQVYCLESLPLGSRILLLDNALAKQGQNMGK